MQPFIKPVNQDAKVAHILWMAEEAMLPHRQYAIKAGGQTVPAQITQLKHKIDVNTLAHSASRTLHLHSNRS